VGGGPSFFVDLWDVGGSARYTETRSVFYTDYHGEYARGSVFL
jgi:hypothetical protein